MLSARRAIALAASSLMTVAQYTNATMGNPRTVKNVFHSPQLKEGGGFVVRRSIGVLMELPGEAALIYPGALKCKMELRSKTHFAFFMSVQARVTCPCSIRS